MGAGMDPSDSDVRLSQALPLFERRAEALVLRLREALSAPSPPDADAAEELAALRRELDEQLPALEALFTRLLIQHLGEEHLPGVLAALQSEAVQHYLHSAPQLDAELPPEVLRLNEQMVAIAQRVLAR